MTSKMCKLLGVGCTEEDHDTKVGDKLRQGKSLDYDEQKKYIEMLESKLRKCEKQLGEVA